MSANKRTVMYKWCA